MNSTSLRVIDSISTVVDSCVLLDVLTEDPNWGKWSEDALTEAADEGRLVINQLIYAEVCVRFPQVEDVDAALPQDLFIRESLPYSAGFLASQAFVDYRRRGGARRSPLPDFYIGAHAAVNRYRLLTRDTRRFGTYFPGVRLVTPENG